MHEQIATFARALFFLESTPTKLLARADQPSLVRKALTVIRLVLVIGRIRLLTWLSTFSR